MPYMRDEANVHFQQLQSDQQRYNAEEFRLTIKIVVLGAGLVKIR